MSLGTIGSSAISTADAAKLLGITRRRVLQLLASGRLYGHKLVHGRRGIWIVATNDQGLPVQTDSISQRIHVKGRKGLGS